MPIYEYSCQTCGASFEELILRSSDEAEVACPKCGAREVERQISSTAIVAAGDAGGAPGRACGPVG